MSVTNNILAKKENRHISIHVCVECFEALCSYKIVQHNCSSVIGTDSQAFSQSGIEVIPHAFLSMEANPYPFLALIVPLPNYVL